MTSCVGALISSFTPKYYNALTLCPCNYAVLSRTQPNDCPRPWIRAGATGQEGTRAVEQRSLLKTIRRGSSGSQLSAGGVRHERMADGHETTDPSGYFDAGYCGSRWRHDACVTCGCRHGDAQRLFNHRRLFVPSSTRTQSDI
jgi:hypothetical protein